MPDDLGDKIHKLRLEKGMTLEELGNRVGSGKSVVRKWETGQIQNMRRDKLVKVAEALGVSVEYLLGVKEKKHEDVPTYYTDPETAKMAQELHDNPNMRLLFDAARDAKPEDLQMAAQLLLRFKETNSE